MAKQKKEDMGDLFDDLEEVAVKAEVRMAGGGGGKILPTELANVLKQKFDNDGTFAVPKDWLEGKIGYNTDGEMKGRPNAIKRKLNRQHAGIVGEGKIWHVGNSGGKFYLISVLDANTEEEDKWKKPKSRKKEEEA